MKNKQGLLDLVARAERGSLLPGEADLLRDAIMLLDDLATTMEKIMTAGSSAVILRGYQPDSTQAMRVVHER